MIARFSRNNSTVNYTTRSYKGYNYKGMFCRVYHNKILVKILNTRCNLLCFQQYPPDTLCENLIVQYFKKLQFSQHMINFDTKTNDLTNYMNIFIKCKEYLQDGELKVSNIAQHIAEVNGDDTCQFLNMNILSLFLFTRCL